MSPEMSLIDRFVNDVMQLAERVRSDTAQIPQRLVFPGIDATSGEASMSQFTNSFLDDPSVAPEHTGFPNIDEAFPSEAIHNGSDSISFNIGYEPTNAMLHEPALEQFHHRSGGDLQSSGTIFSDERSGGGLEAIFLARGDAQSVEAHSPQASITLGHFNAGSMRLDELFPDHERNDSTIFESRYDLYVRYTQGSSGSRSKPIFHYRLDRTYLSEDGTPPQGELPFWIRAEDGRNVANPEDGRSVVNAEEVPLRYSKYLPVTVATSIKGWQMELIMKHDHNIRDKDFYDRMPVSKPHSRPTVHALRSRRASAKNKYIFRELSDVTAVNITEQEDIGN